MHSIIRACCLWSASILALVALQAEDYRWDTATIGGGGYVTGIAIHPTASDRRYIRTDVGGAYRWDGATQRWIQMLAWVGGGNLIGVDGLALDANRPDRIYLALGKNLGDGGVYRSDDQGVTWSRLLTAQFNGNGRDQRWAGECLAVDPHTSAVIYCGTRIDGLWRSGDEGATWSKITSVPNGYTGTNPTGVRAVAVDPATTVGGRSAIVYVGLPGGGIYRSSDGGLTFSALAGAPAAPRRLQVVAGRLWVTHGSGVALWADGVWKDATPAAGAGKDYCALAVDAADWRKVVVAQRYSSYFNPMFRSSDGGTGWGQINTGAVPAVLHVEPPWWQQNRFSSATAGMAFVPGSGELFYTDWFGVWRTPDVWAGTTQWFTLERGHEETVVLTVVAPPSGALVYSGMADNFGFRHDNLDTFPAKKLYPMAEGFSIAYCEQAPANLAVLGAKTWAGDNLTLATSADRGENWTVRTLPSGVQLGRIACSSSSPDHLVYVAGGGAVYCSADRGASWQTSQGAPSGAVGLSDIWNKDFAIAADCVDGQRFYLFKGGVLYASGDAGATWTRRNATAIPSQSGFLNVVARPGHAGEVWISLDGNGLWRSGDGGATFARIAALSGASLVSFGAPAPGGTDTAVYCCGTSGGVWGMWRSLDSGATWQRINDDAHQFPAGAKCLAADRQVFGRVFVGTGGCGLIYGEPTAVLLPAITTQPTDAVAQAGQTATFTVAATGATSWQWQRDGVDLGGAVSASYTTPVLAAGDSGAGFRCVVGNAAGTVTSTTAILTLTSANVAPVITALTATPATLTLPATTTLAVTATDADGDSLACAWSTVGGPGGVTFGSANAASSSAAFATAGTYILQASVSDGHGHAVTGTATVVVHPANHAPVLAHALSGRTGTVGTRLSFSLPSDAFTDADGDTLAWSASVLPAWLQFDAGTRTFSGTPDATGTIAITITVSDPSSATASGGFDLVIVAADASGGGGGTSRHGGSGGGGGCGLGGGAGLLGAGFTLALAGRRQRKAAAGR